MQHHRFEGVVIVDGVSETAVGERGARRARCAPAQQCRPLAWCGAGDVAGDAVADRVARPVDRNPEDVTDAREGWLVGLCGQLVERGCTQRDERVCG